MEPDDPQDSNDALKKCFKCSLGEEAEELKTVTRGLFEHSEF